MPRLLDAEVKPFEVLCFKGLFGFSGLVRNSWCYIFFVIWNDLYSTLCMDCYTLRMTRTKQIIGFASTIESCS